MTIRLNVNTLLNERDMTPYMLYKCFNLVMSYPQFQKIINNQTRAIKYDYLDTMMRVFNCNIEDLFIEEEN